MNQRILEYQGFIHTRSGKNSGTFVKSRQGNAVCDYFNLLMRSHKCSANDLVEVREKIECAAVEIAAANVTDLDIHQLKQSREEAERYSKKSRKSIKKFIAADIRFHLRLCRIAGNPLYDQILGAIYSLNPYYKRFLNLKGEQMKGNLEDLIDIFLAFSHHHPEEAKRISKHHIYKFN